MTTETQDTSRVETKPDVVELQQPEKVKRTRTPRQTKAKSEAPKVGFSKDAIAGYLLIGHEFAAAHFGQELLRLQKAEAESLAGAICDVAGHYNLEMEKKTVDILTLVGTIGVIYGSRVFMYHRAKQAAILAAKEQARNAGASFQFSE